MPPENETSDLRSTIEDAYDAAESEAGRPTTDAEKPVRTATEAPSTDTAKPAAEDRGDGRRVDGKYARKAAAVDAGGKPADPGTAADPALAGDAQKPVEAAKADPYAKAPQSWKPGAREAWGQLPAEVRAEVHRREREAHHVMQETTQARQVHDYLGQLQQKYAPALQAEGVDVLTASANLMELSSKLRFGTQPEKAALAAQIIRNYGVDVNALADALDGRPVQQGQQQQPQQMMTDPRVDQLLAQLQGLTQSRQEAVQQRAVTEVETFGGDKEFFEDVREDMADLLEVAARRGIDLSLEQAYERACKMQPDIAKVLEAREAAQRAGTGRRSTQQARLAASSVRGSPGSGPSSQPDNLRASIEAAIEQVGGR